MDQSWVLIDTASGLHVAWYFWLRVLDEVNRAARYGAPFGLLMLEVESEHQNQSRTATEALTHVAAAIRSTDLAGVIAPGVAAVLLPHQDAAAAATARARILERIARSCPASMRFGSTLFCYPEDAAAVSNLLTSGGSKRGLVDRELGAAS